MSMHHLRFQPPKPLKTTLANLALVYNALVILGILALAGVSGASLYYFRINGIIYARIVNSRDIVADVLPPPLYVIEAYQEVTDLRDHAADIDARSNRLAALHAQYEERQSYWSAANIDSELKRKLTIDSYIEGGRFWREIETHYLPAVRAGDREAMLRSFDEIKSFYAAHRAVVDDVVKMTNAYTATIEREGRATEELLFYFLISATLLSLYMTAFAIGQIRDKIIAPLASLAEYMTRRSADGKAQVPFLDRTDEIGIVAQAVDSFRSKVEQHAVEDQKAHLDAALNNIVQGVEMYDAEKRLVLCNARFIEIYALHEESALAGKTLEEVISIRSTASLLRDERADNLSARIALAATSPDESEFFSDLADGRCIHISVRRFIDRGGFIITHQDVTEQRRSEERTTYYALHDPLTGLPNRFQLNHELESALALARCGELVAVHMLDLDNFKSVNDTLGHPIGDGLLSTVARRLRLALRETDTISRMGGDEFAIVERQISDPLDAIELATRLIAAIGEPFDIDGHSITIGTSIGIAIGPKDGASAEAIMRNADLALYRAKGDGRGTFRFFEPDMDTQMQERCQLEKDLRSALSKDEFELHFQPIVNVDDNHICAFEALIRWRHPMRGLIPPCAFIPLAEETRLIVAIGAWVLEQACIAAVKWPERIKVAVNLSAVQFRSGDVEQVVSRSLLVSGLSPNRLEIEITESILLDGSQETLSTLHRLRDLGVRVAMDDFGTGYSSLSYLQSFPFDKIKIDKSFVQGIGDDPKSQNIVRAVTALANGLGIQTTAEGVESSAQLEAVKSEGCSEVQGYLMSKPLPLKDVELLLMARGEFVRDDAAVGRRRYSA